MERKTGLFTEEEEKLAAITKALSHPARIKILKILAEKNVCMTGSIVDLLPLAQSTVSQHLKELKNAGLIKGEIDGPKICYCINKTVMSKVKENLGNLMSQLDREKGGSSE
jgi:ArsR family transcriptional regulator, arsenate/arsenite/antimonite-responsive transcriptional repressor